MLQGRSDDLGSLCICCGARVDVIPGESFRVIAENFVEIEELEALPSCNLLQFRACNEVEVAFWPNDEEAGERTREELV